MDCVTNILYVSNTAQRGRALSLTDLESTVEAYRNGADLANQLIVALMPIVDKEIRRYVSRRHKFEDLQELAYFELTTAILKARDKLVDNDITSFVMFRILFAILNYKAYNHRLCENKVPSNHPLKLGKLQREPFVEPAIQDTYVNEIDCVDLLDKCVTCEEQRTVVHHRLDGQRFCHIEDMVPYLTPYQIRKYWSDFVCCFHRYKD